MKLKKLDLWCIIAPIVMLVICLITKTGLLQAITSVTGVIYLSLIANKNKHGYLFSIVNVLFYAILTWKKGLFGTAIMNVVYTLPILVYGYIYWSKNQGKDKGQIKIMRNSGKIKLIICILIVIVVCYLFSYYIFNLEHALMDSVVICLSLIGNILMARKYIEQWYIWIALNLINIIWWFIASISDSNSISIIFMYIIYLVNNIIGLMSWNNWKMKK